MAETMCYHLKESELIEDFRPTLVADRVFKSFLCYTAIILNIVTIHVIRKTASLPKPLRTLLLSLTFSDVGVGLLAQPLHISYLVRRLQQKSVDCLFYRISLAVIIFFGLSSFLNVAAISLDRFLAIHLHLRYQELVSHKRIFAVLILMWLFSAVVSLSLAWNSLSNISKFISPVIMTVCLILVIIVNWRIYIALKRHKNQIQSLQIQEVGQGTQNGDISNFLRIRKSALGTFYVCIVFLICYLPFTVISILLLVHSSTSISLNKANQYAVTLILLNSSLNPMIYCWKMEPIRRTLIDILRGIINRLRQS